MLLPLSVLVLVASTVALGNDQPKREVLLERVEKIYTDGRWNGRPTITFWKGHYYIFFHAGAEHSSADGEIRVLKSSGKQPTPLCQNA